MSDPATIGEGLSHQSANSPEKVAIIGTTFGSLTYQDLKNQIDETCIGLRQSGFGREARIAVAIADSGYAALAIIAVSCCATAVPIDSKLTVGEAERCLRIVNTDAIILLHGMASAARSAAEQACCTIIEARPSPGGTLGLILDVPKVAPASVSAEPEPDTPAFILHTSGTTAAPNFVPFNHRNVLAATQRLETWFGLGPQDRCLMVSPVYYSHALTTTVLPPLLTGGSFALPENPTNVDVVEWFGALRPTWYSAGPTLHLAVLEKFQQCDDASGMHALRFISSAGAPLAQDVGGLLQGLLGIPVLEHYGSSETAQIASNQLPPGPSKAGTCGKPWPDILTIVGDDGQPLPNGERGEVLVRGPSVMAGYVNNPDLDRAAFVNGWFRTGDIASLDHDGFLTLHGRHKEIINRGAEKIAPLEIDHALMLHPAVAQAAAYGVPHPRLGEDVAAAVVLCEGSQVTPRELRDFLNAYLARFKIPRRIVIVDQLPKGISGKVQRKQLSQNHAKLG